jgi:DNA mismatch repair protein MutL
MGKVNNTNSNYNAAIDTMAEMRQAVDEYKNIKQNNTEPTNTEDTIKNNLEETKIIDTIPDTEKTQVIDMSEIIEKSKELENVKMEHDNNFEEMYTSVFGANIVKEDDEKYENVESVLEEAKISTGENISIFEKENKTIPQYKFIGIAFSTYIIIELDKDLYIIDQHAAHERIMYEKVKENYYSDTNKDSQLMLLPDIITLTHKEMGIAKDNMEMFEKAGFSLEEFGENTIKLTGVPNVCIDLDTKELFLETLDEINTVARTAKQEIEEKFIATVACKAAVKANMALTKEEVDSLMQKLLRLPNPFTCPHGRPTAIKMTKTDIEKKFSRR